MMFRLVFTTAPPVPADELLPNELWFLTLLPLKLLFSYALKSFSLGFLLMALFMMSTAFWTRAPLKSLAEDDYAVFAGRI